MRQYGDLDRLDFDDLEEVERADAILEGRDPTQSKEVIKARKLAELEALARAEQVARVLRERKRRRRALLRKVLLTGGAMGIAAFGTIPVTRWFIRQTRRNETLQVRLEKRGAPLGSHGFRLAKEWLDVPPAGVVAALDRDSCSAILSATEDEPADTQIKILRQKTDPSIGNGAVVLCSCDAEEVTIKVPDRAEKRTAVRLLTSPMRDSGGIEVLLASSLVGFSVVDDDLSRGCSSHALEAWTKNPRHGAMTPIDAKDNTAASAFLREGMEAEGLVESTRAFAALHARQNTCYLAAAASASSAIYLRTPNGTRYDVKPASALAFCSYAGDVSLSIWRDKGPASDVAVVRAPASKIGGLTGTKALAIRNGHPQARTILEPQELTSDATASLLAATVQQGTIVAAGENGLPGKLDDRLAAFSLAESATFLPEVSPRVPTACLPSYPVPEGFRAFICAQQRPQVWKGNGNRAHQGAVEGRLPFWLSVLSDQGDPGALEAVVHALSFAQRMTLMGFEPSTIDGVTDVPTGATILGRPGKTEAVALGITRTKPFLFPLSASKTSWTLDGPIVTTPLAEGKVVSFHSRLSLGGDKASRRVVVFRR